MKFVLFLDDVKLLAIFLCKKKKKAYLVKTRKANLGRKLKVTLFFRQYFSGN